MTLPLSFTRTDSVNRTSHLVAMLKCIDAIGQHHSKKWVAVLACIVCLCYPAMLSQLLPSMSSSPYLAAGMLTDSIYRSMPGTDHPTPRSSSSRPRSRFDSKLGRIQSWHGTKSRPRSSLSPRFSDTPRSAPIDAHSDCFHIALTLAYRVCLHGNKDQTTRGNCRGACNVLQL